MTKLILNSEFRIVFIIKLKIKHPTSCEFQKLYLQIFFHCYTQLLLFPDVIVTIKVCQT